MLKTLGLGNDRPEEGKTMTRPKQRSPNTYVVANSLPAKLFSNSSPRDSLYSSISEAKLSRYPLFLSVLWAMILPLVIASLLGCTGAGSGSAGVSQSSPPITTPLEITTVTLPVGTVKDSYTTTLGATGGIPPYSWSSSGGQLPTGMTLNSPTGIIAGTPIDAGASSFSATVQDSKSSSASAGFSLRISPAPAPSPQPISNRLEITTLALPVGTVQDNYATTLAATGGVPPYSWISTSGQLPTGLTLNSPTGTIAGIPIDVGAFSFTVKVEDSNASSAFSSTSAGFSLSISPAAVIASTQSWNPSVLGVAWASDFTSIAANQINVKTDPRLSVKAAGDGITDDTSAIRAAIQLASSTGGGVVYFPTSDYKIIVSSDSAKGNPLVVPSRVVLRGDNSTASRIFVNDLGAANESDGTWTWGGIDFQGSSLSGMTDLGVYAVNSSNSTFAVLWNRGSTKVSELFFNNLDVHLNNCRAFWFEATNNLLVQNSQFDSSNSLNGGNSSQYGPIYAVSNSNLSFLNNRITYHFGRLHMQNNTNLLMQGNTLIRDAQNQDMDNGTAVESGGVELSFGQNVQVLNNTIQTVNAPPAELGDGEAIMSQQSVTPDALDAGSSTAITSNTLTDTKALWGSVTVSSIAQYSEVVAILTGSATGEWRTIQVVNTGTKTVTLTQAWSPVPEVGSLYSIFAWTLTNATFQGNTLTDNPNGIVLYDGCYGCTVQSNTLMNSRGIILRTVDELLNPSIYPEGRRVHEVAIGDKILGNTVANTSGIRPAYIALDTEAFDPTNYNGMGMFNIQVGGNTITPYSASPSQAYNPQAIEISQEGFFPCFLFGPAAIKAPVTTVFQNINYWNNLQNASITYSSTFLPYATQACVTPSAPPTAP